MQGSIQAVVDSQRAPCSVAVRRFGRRIPAAVVRASSRQQGEVRRPGVLVEEKADKRRRGVLGAESVDGGAEDVLARDLRIQRAPSSEAAADAVGKVRPCLAQYRSRVGKRVGGRRS